MRAFILSALTALCLTTPVLSSSLLPRRQVCANDGKTVAGTTFSARSLPSIPSLSIRQDVPIPCIWCQIGGTTYIIITSFTQGPGPPATGELQYMAVLSAIVHIATLIMQHGDDVLHGGTLEYSVEGMSLRGMNSNNHQMTLGVLQSALLAIRSWMEAYSVWGTAVFQVYDGDHQVGTGSMSL